MKATVSFWAKNLSELLYEINIRQYISLDGEHVVKSYAR